MIRWRLGVVLALAASAVSAAVLNDVAIRDSMMVKGSLMGQRWLEKNGLDDYLGRQSWKPTQGNGLECVGRWSYGPSLKVSLRVTSGDTVICLTRGSGATLARFRSRDSVAFDLLGDLNFAGIPRRAILADTLVVAGIHSGGTGLEVHGVSNPAQPNLLSRVDLPVVNDIAVKDTFVYAACEDDTLRIYNIANPRQPVLVGACRDSCDLFMTQAGNYCYLVHVSGVNIVDVSNPANPHRAGRIGGGEPLAVYVRDTLCYDMVFGEGLRIYNVKDVASPHEVGSLTLGDAMDLTMPSTEDTLLYTSLLDVVKVTNPASPSLVGHVDIPAEDEDGVVVVPAANYALVANYTDGVVAVDVTSPASPTIDTTAFGAGSSQDIYVDGTRAYLASPLNGMTILDVSDPTRPTRLGGVDIIGLNPACMSVVARDSFAYMHWYQRPQFQSVDVTDPTRPQRVGGADVTGPPEDMVIQDSFVYVAEINRFQIVNVARPREPVLVGNCLLSATGRSVAVRDTVAYIAMGSSGLVCVSIRDPEVPSVIGNWAGRSSGVSLSDTLAYVAGPYTGLVSLNVSDPSSPVVIDSLGLSDTLWWNDVRTSGLRAYVGGERVLTVDVSDPADLRVRGSLSPPSLVQELAYKSPYLYAACLEAGVCVYESTAVGIEDGVLHSPAPARLLRVEPNPAHSVVLVTGISGKSYVSVFDATGRNVTNRVHVASDAEFLRVGIERLPRGLYFLCLGDRKVRDVVKLVKR